MPKWLRSFYPSWMEQRLALVLELRLPTLQQDTLPVHSESHYFIVRVCLSFQARVNLISSQGGA